MVSSGDELRLDPALPRQLAPFSAIDPFLWLALIAMFTIGIYQFSKQLGLLPA